MACWGGGEFPPTSSAVKQLSPRAVPSSETPATLCLPTPLSEATPVFQHPSEAIPIFQTPALKPHPVFNTPAPKPAPFLQHTFPKPSPVFQHPSPSSYRTPPPLLQPSLLSTPATPVFHGGQDPSSPSSGKTESNPPTLPLPPFPPCVLFFTAHDHFPPGSGSRLTPSPPHYNLEPFR
ncbi:uncharacterized protein [Macrobrachium rosenbergii]|uniref:uncharacterized protein n=1 Tax=Macrobrachium rosenbergii TaxID=79674 RepID=UPI0034D3D117